jgi:P27 family predicted phage terminase small subunit
MGRRGPRPKPTALKILRGTRRDRVNHAEPALAADAVAPPSWLDGDSLAHWHRLAPQLLAAGVLRNGDCEALARLCWLHTQWRKHAQLCERGADIIVMKDEAGKIRYAQVSPSATLVTKFGAAMAKLEAEFGLTPSSRSSLVVTERPTDALDQWLRDNRA